MIEDPLLKKRWTRLVQQLCEQFQLDDTLDLEGVIYLIGIQEVGRIHHTFKKDEKLNLMHVAICKLLEPYGYYAFEYLDSEGWPHYRLLERLPQLKPKDQSILMKEAIVTYFLKNEFID